MEIEPNDASVIRRVLDGDTETFRILVDRYGDRLFRFCRARLGDDADSEDAVQDVFIRAFRSLGSYDPARSWSSWLFAIAANRVKSRYGLRVSAQDLVERAGREVMAMDGVAESGFDPERLTLEAMMGQEIRSAVAALPHSYRAPVELYYFAGLGVADVAATLGLGEEAVKTRLFRARKELLAWFDEKKQLRTGRRGRY